MDDEERYRINVFDWAAEFPQIFAKGGFDAVIGNPPYGAMFNNQVKRYLSTIFTKIKGQPESYEYFIINAIDKMCKKEGYISYIVPTNFIESQRAEGLREHFITEGRFKLLSVFRYNVWKNNASETLVFIYIKDKVDRPTVQVVHPKTKNQFIQNENSRLFIQDEWQKIKGKRFLIRANVTLITKIESRNITLDDICDVTQGIIVYKTREDSKKNLYISDSRKNDQWKKLLDTHSRVQRYSISWGGKYLHYGDWLWCPRDPKYFEMPKIVFVRLRNKLLNRKLIGIYDDNKFYNRDNFNNIIMKNNEYSIKYILSLFNSQLVNYWYKAYFDNVNINPTQVRMIPIRKIDFSNTKEKAQHDKLVNLVDRMLELNKQLPKTKTDHDRTTLQRQIDATDQQIDKLVYELYDLTDEEIKIVEGGS